MAKVNLIDFVCINDHDLLLQRNIFEVTLVTFNRAREQEVYLCAECIGHGFCKKCESVLVTDTELEDPIFRRNVQRTAHNLDVSASDWLEHVNDLYREYRGRIVTKNGAEVLLDMECFETSSIREWFRDFVNAPVDADKPSRLRGESKERIRALATILRAHYPVEAMLWTVEVANDDRKSEQ